MEYLTMAINVTKDDGRLEYLKWHVLNFGMLIITVTLVEILKTDFAFSALAFSIIGTAIYFCMSFCINARRMNDLNMSHWHMVGLFVPVWNLLLSIYMLLARGK